MMDTGSEVDAGDMAPQVPISDQGVPDSQVLPSCDPPLGLTPTSSFVAA